MKKVFPKQFLHSAFTMIELVFVIVVIGILTAIIIPNTKTNPLEEAAIQVASHIRYTQHLAMVDDTFDANDSNWYKKRWQLAFSKSIYTGGTQAYTIFSDTAGTSTGDAQESEIALNPQNNAQIMTGGYGNAQAIDFRHANFKGMKKLNIGSSYGVESVSLNGGCDNSRVVFDNLGRPMKGDMSGNIQAYENDNLIQTDCVVLLKDANDNNVSIIIRPETGYATISF